MNPDRINKVVGDPVMGMDSSYAGSASATGNSQVVVGTANRGVSYEPATDQSTVQSNIAGAKGEVETTASTENLSAQYKYPRNSQSTVAEDLVAKPNSSI